ncbi:MAG: DUF4097 domain-containing protein, partial [Defluviitaleaceae bacterium]|nr:DUF4097 domain-containing protein [Defluviitaleaceae bacterium]
IFLTIAIGTIFAGITIFSNSIRNVNLVNNFVDGRFDDIESAELLPETLQLNLAEISNLRITSRNISIIVTPHSNPHVLITYEQNSEGQNEQPRYRLTGTTLEIAQPNPPATQGNWFNLIDNSSQNGVITVFFPENTDNIFDLLDILSVSGNIDITGNSGNFLANTLEISGTSANITALNFDANAANFRSISGRISADFISLGGDLEVRTTSGGVQIGNIIASNTNLSSISGTLTADTIATGELHINSTSGGVQVNLAELDSFYARAISGALNVQNSSVASDITMRTTSGNITVNNVNYNGDYIDANSISGTIRIDGVVN